METTGIDIAEQDYMGPGRWAAAGALAAIEAKVAAVVGMPLGAALGAWQYKHVEAYLQRHPGWNKLVEDSVGMFAGSYRHSPQAKAATAGALFVSTALPLIASVHGAVKGYQVADDGMDQFLRAREEVVRLRGELAEAKSWQHKVLEQKVSGPEKGAEAGGGI